MERITAICEKKDMDKNKAALKLSEFEVHFVDKNDVKKSNLDGDLALIVFPWDGYSDALKDAHFKKQLDQHSVVVVGPAIYFFEVENWVIDGSVSFLTSPVNSMQIESIVNEILRTRDVSSRRNKSVKKLRESA